MEKINNLMNQIRTNCTNEEMDLLAYKIKEEISINKSMCEGFDDMDFFEAQADDADKAFDIAQARELK